MRRLRELAERAGPSRERYIDLIRALAITAVVLGHWLISAIGRDARGQLAARSALEALPWAYPITWLVQVMPLFFIVGGYANAASLDSLRRRGGDAAAWLQHRSGRLIRPTTTLFVVLATGALLARFWGADRELTRTAVWAASIPLWFLSAYLMVVLLSPLMRRLHHRYGWWVLPVLVGLVGLGDLARLAGREILGAGSFLFGWLAIHQVGFFWRDGQLPFRPKTWTWLLGGGLVALLGLTLAGPYSVSMIDVSGQRLPNASPPTLALLADATFQLGLIVALRDRAERWLQRPGPWRLVVAVNAVVLTIFLWHMAAVLLLVGALNALHVLPVPPVATTAWWLWRLPWLAMLLAVLAVLVAVLGRVEVQAGRRRPTGSAVPPVRALGPAAGRALARPATRVGLTVAGFAAVIGGLLGNSLAPRTGDYLAGMPAAALIAYLLGAGALRWLRSLPDEKPQPPTATG